jgi:integrin alpha FG-GAP repeat containing protein 1
LLVLDTTYTPSKPVAPALGDVNMDGFPDLLFISDGTPRLLLNQRCSSKTIPGCSGSSRRRGFLEATHLSLNTQILQTITDARGASFVDVDEDGTLDILVQRTGEQGTGTVFVVQNNWYFDAFFLKAIVLNGACGNGWCEGVPGAGAGKESTGTSKYQPFGVSYSGATYKYTVLTTTGQRTAAQGE